MYNRTTHMSYVRTSSRAENDQLDLYPACRVSVTDHGNVYFIPVSGFPIPDEERKSIKGFLVELRKRYANLVESGLFSCLGILDKVLEFEALEKLGHHLFDWPTQGAIALLPDRPPPKFPTRDEVMSWKEKGVPLSHDLMPMITYITKKEAIPEAYDELFGCGGTIFYTSTHNEQKLFAKTKEIFGYRITNQILQFMNCLPVLGINALLDATDYQFRALYSAVGLYIGESMQDAGVVIISDKKLDAEISELAYMLPDAY
jgi:hypothetical protein